MAGDVVGRPGAARLLGVSITRVQQLMEAGRLPGEKVDGRWLIQRSALDRLVLKPCGRPRRAVQDPPVEQPRTNVPPAPVPIQRPVFRPTIRAVTDVGDVTYERDESAQLPSDW